MRCDPSSIPITVDLGNVTITVMHNTERVFPNGDPTQDSTLNGPIEGTVALSPPEEIPFYEGNYRILYVRTIMYQLCELDP